MRYRVLLKYKDPEFHPAYFYRYLPALRWYQKLVMQSDVHFQRRENGVWVTCLPYLDGTASPLPVRRGGGSVFLRERSG